MINSKITEIIIKNRIQMYFRVIRILISKKTGFERNFVIIII